MGFIKKRGVEPSYINDFSFSLLDGFYLNEGETVDDALARAAEAFCFGDYELGQRIYEAAHDGWFMYASPVLANAPVGSWVGQPNKSDWTLDDTLKYFKGDTSRALPISCFSILAPDSIDGQMDAMKELAVLSVSGGGVGIHNKIRATSKKAPGPIPFEKVLDAEIGYYKQSSTRRGATAYYMDVNHPDIIEHIKFREPTGGDRKRRSDNITQFHTAVNVTDDFIDAVNNDESFDLTCPHSGEVKETLPARDLWETILETRAQTGEPFLFKVDTANRAMPQTQKDLGLEINGSNICVEISLPTSEDRSFVCCLSSLNLAKFDEWKDSTLVADLTVYLDNVIQYFIEVASTLNGMERVVNSARKERAIGIGAMGWHHFLQGKGLSFEGGGFNSPIQFTHILFSKIKKEAVDASLRLGELRGEPDDMLGTGRRNSNLLAVAPNANSGIVLGVSPSIEPESGVAYVHSTRAGSHVVKNPIFQALLDELIPEDEHEAIWLDIIAHDGSVQHLEFLSEQQKAVFKNAYEIDQHWVIEQADARQQYICQSQSLNLFFPAGISKAYYNSVHLKALRAPYLKSLYYSRMRRGTNHSVDRKWEKRTLINWQPTEEAEDCIACSG